VSHAIVNIINFIRAVEPRDPGLDLAEPVRNQLRLLAAHGLPGTFLLQHDALLEPRFTEPLREAAGDRVELGAWLEIVRPLAERAGIPWRGRPGFDWDWHAHVGFSVGYTPREREALVDVLMRDFREAFGAYPLSVGSWIIDAHTLAYLSDRYGIAASCNCKDQWGTDGYTLWGGYVNQGYYPSRSNVLAPASGAERAIPVPVFRMLGPDPIYQYDAGFQEEDAPGVNGQPVVTLEPVYPVGGGSPAWVRWFFGEMARGPSLSFGYAQVGQENSFGWKAMAAGLEDQLALVAERRRAGELRVECLRDTGRWFRARYPATPASAVTALSDWKGQGRGSIWYCSRFYRINLYREGGRTWIRDLHRFDDEYPERYLRTACREPALWYDNLPLMDGNRWSGGGVRAGIRFVRSGPEPVELSFGDPEVREDGAEELLVSLPISGGGTCQVRCAPEEACISIAGARLDAGWGLELAWDARRAVPVTGADDGAVRYLHNGWPYALRAEGARSIRAAGPGRLLIDARAGEIALRPCAGTPS
jgi:hypothetical protein